MWRELVFVNTSQVKDLRAIFVLLYLKLFTVQTYK